jgi:hypothetical protein
MPNPATGTYTLINVGEGTGGGMMKNRAMLGLWQSKIR